MCVCVCVCVCVYILYFLSDDCSDTLKFKKIESYLGYIILGFRV